MGEPEEVSVREERGGGLDRFATPLYSVAEAARYLDVPVSTFATWTHGYRRRPAGRRKVVGGPVLTALPRSGVRAPIIPFIGLAEGLVLAAMRRSGVSLQRIRPALERLDEEFGLAHALASQRLYTDGAEVLFDYAESANDPTAARAALDLVVVRNDQRVFNEVVAAYLQRVDFAPRVIPGLSIYRPTRSLTSSLIPSADSDSRSSLAAARGWKMRSGSFGRVSRSMSLPMSTAYGRCRRSCATAGG
jgi:hypothetical protein